MKRTLCLAFLLLTSSQNGSSAPRDPAGFLSSVPALTQWVAIGSPKSLNAEDYAKSQGRDFNILNEYGFLRMAQQDFARDGGRITAELFEMMDFAAAYGFYTFSRKPEAKPLEKIGNIGQELEQSITFVQNKYFVRLSTGVREAAPRTSLMRLGNAVSQLLPTSFSGPPILTHLPRENLVPSSAVFVLGFQALRHRYPPLGQSDIFGMSNGAEGVLAEYRFPEDAATLLLISYPTQQLAKKFLESGYQAYSARHLSQSLFYKREGPLAVLVFGARTAEVATKLLDRISYVSTVSWDPKTQPLGVARMMLNIFLYTGVMLSISLIAGIFFGLLRIIVKKTLPGRIFDHPNNAEVIKLNLQFPRE